ncbi:ABC transporter permease [Aggregatilinea lenta]|uniref:ABC transporter permease n=1 Tax=Aggregatilinea lenta TaxID=913108 RepID=UPI000E5BE05E|nr:ABC transporter permease [Aggregatilinea lenta]
MGGYVIRRLLISIPVLFLVTFLVFTLIEIAPGDVVDYFISPESMQYTTEADIQRLRERTGLDQPFLVRYGKWLGHLAQGDLGYSFVESKPVGGLIVDHMKNTLPLMGAAWLMGIVFGITLGVFVGLRQYSVWDFSLTGFSFLGLSIPAFISGILGLYIFSVRLGWFPAGGMRTAGGESSLSDSLYHLVLPATTLALMDIARNMRYMRFSMLEVLNQDYITTARAKGLRPRLVNYRHAMRNALLPVVTVTGMSLPQLVAGAVFIETIYSWRGMGTLYLNAVSGRDYPVIMGVNLVFAVMVLGANLLTDIVYSIVDPRVRFEG